MLDLFFGKRSISVDEKTWKDSLFSIKYAIVEQLCVVEEVPDCKQAFTSMFYHLHNTGLQDWATTFLKCLAGKIIEINVMNLSERLCLLIGDSGLGAAFECLGHETLIKSNDNQTATSIIKRQRPKECKFKVPNKVEVFRKISDISKLSTGCYGLPVNGNFPSIDAVIQPNILLQFAKSRRHPGIDDKTKEIRVHLSAAEKDHRLVFVVPKEMIKNYPKQDGYGDIKQCVMTYYTFHNEGSPMEIDDA
eukprot:gene10065-11140_t